jgi:hypothetical protein
VSSASTRTDAEGISRRRDAIYTHVVLPLENLCLDLGIIDNGDKFERLPYTDPRVEHPDSTAKVENEWKPSHKSKPINIPAARHVGTKISVSNPLTHVDYTVGWVCALPLEMASARAMLDECHPSLPNKLGDENTYVYGAISGHNIVMTCLPSGVYGTTSAAIVATSMRSSFSALRSSLLVGIGGTAPGNVDIRLGDVIVSKPTGIYGGVVQYDYGKTLSSGKSPGRDH